MVLVTGVRVEHICPLLAGAWQPVPGPMALLGGSGLQSWGKPCWGPRPRVQPGCALGLNAEWRHACGKGGALLWGQGV